MNLTATARDTFTDQRTGKNSKNTQHSMVALLRQSVFSRLAGYEDTNDADRLSVDPAMRFVVGGRACEHQAASTSQMSRFETEVLTQTENLIALKKMPLPSPTAIFPSSPPLPTAPANPSSSLNSPTDTLIAHFWTLCLQHDTEAHGYCLPDSIV